MIHEQELRDTGKDVGIAIAGEIIYLILGYGITFLIARGSGPTALGIYSISLLVLRIGELCCTLGLKRANLYYIPLYTRSGQGDLVKGLFLFTSRMSGFLGVVMGVALFGFSVWAKTLFKEPALSNALRIVALTIPLFALRGVWSYALQGFKAIKYKVFAEKILEPGVRFVAVGLFLLLGVKLLGSILAILAGILMSTVAAFYFLKALMASMPGEGQITYESRTWLLYAIPLLLQSLALSLQPGISLLVLEHLRDSSQVGIFSAAFRVSMLISLPLVGLNTVFAPRISELDGGGEVEKLGSLYRTMTAWTISTSLLPFLIIFLFAEPIMHVFGPEFEAGSSILGLLAVGHLTSAVSGSAGCMLVMTGRVNLSLINALLGTLLSFLLNLLLIPSLGISGAAVASTAVLAGVGLLGLVEVFYLLRIQPYSRNSLRPAIAGGIAALGLLLLPGQGVKFSQIFLFLPVYLGLFWFLSSADEKDWTRNILATMIQGVIRLLRPG